MYDTPPLIPEILYKKVALLDIFLCDCWQVDNYRGD